MFSIVNQMNNKRLSTSDSVMGDRTLLHSQGYWIIKWTFKHWNERWKTLSLNEVVNKGMVVQILYVNSSDILEEFKSYTECARFLGVHLRLYYIELEKVTLLPFNLD